MKPLSIEAVKMYYEEKMKENKLEKLSLPGKNRHLIEYKVPGALKYYFNGKLIHDTSILNNYELFD